MLLKPCSCKTGKGDAAWAGRECYYGFVLRRSGTVSCATSAQHFVNLHMHALVPPHVLPKLG